MSAAGKLAFDPNNMDSVLSHILTRLDSMEESRKSQHAENKETLADLRKDMEDVKRWRWSTLGACVILNLVCGIAVTLIVAAKFGH